MAAQTTATHDKIKKAVQLRLCGSTWEEVGKELKYKNGEAARTTLTVGHNRETWREEYEKAREKWLDALEVEATSTQQRLMRSARSEHVQQMAAHSLLAHIAKLRGQKIEISGKNGEAVELGGEALQLILGILDKHPTAKRAMIAGLNGRLVGRCQADITGN